MPSDATTAEDKNAKPASSSSGSTILSSAYFQPRIVDTYLQSSLDAADFPKKSIHELRSILRNLDDVHTGARLVKVRKDFQLISRSISEKGREALKGAMRALSAQLVILSQKKSNTFSDDAEYQQEEWRRRCLLGYCKILDQHWHEAIVQLDVVRSDIYRCMSRGKDQKEIKQGQMMRPIYTDCLYALELASLLLAKPADAARYAKWRMAVQSS